jgi:acyl dehydratase
MNTQTLLGWPFEPVEQSYDSRDTMLYALGSGMSSDPLDREELRFTYEAGLKVLPTYPVVLCSPGAWYRAPEAGMDWVKMLHVEQRLTLHRPLPVAATVIGLTRITGIVDKGPGKGALLYLERELREKATDAALATIGQTLLFRGNGGCGSTQQQALAPHPMPERAPDLSVERRIDSRAALIYRLSGDYNPLHADPDIAGRAGFHAPIFHGLGTFGMTGCELLRHACAFNPERLTSIAVRFTAPVYPGERLTTSLWLEGDTVSFRATVAERGVTVLDNGFASICAGN